MSLPNTNGVYEHNAALDFGQRVSVRSNGDPGDPYTGATGKIFQRMAGPDAMYGVLFDEVVNGRWMGNFRADELEAVA